MKLEYLHNISQDGKYHDVVSDNLVRLFNFDEAETNQLIAIIQDKLLTQDHEISLSAITFIEPLNCTLTLALAKEDNGILKTETPNNFICQLTKESYQNMIERMALTGNGYNWLCDAADEDIDFLYSPGGGW